MGHYINAYLQACLESTTHHLVMWSTAVKYGKMDVEKSNVHEDR